MAERRVSVRLSAVDGERLKAELDAIGKEGQRSLARIGKAANDAGGGLDRIDGASARTLKQLEALSARATRAAESLRAAGVVTGSVAERIDHLAGVTGRVHRSADDIAAYGAALDGLRAKYNPLFAAIQQYRAAQAEIRQAHAVGAISADEMAAAISRERQAALASIAAIKGRTTALMGMSKASRAANAQSRQLMFQLVDLGQAIPLAFQSPLYALQNVGFQIAQIGQLYAGQGGFGQALRDSAGQVGRFAVRLGPAALAVGAVTAAVAGMTYEINQAQDVTVGFGDVALATWQTIAAGLETVVRPVAEAIAPWFSAAWDAIVAGVKFTGNIIINSFRAAYEDVIFVWNALPAAFSAAVVGAANAALSGIETMVNRAIELLNGLSEAVNSVLSEIPGLSEGFRIGRIEPVSIELPENTFADDLARQVADRNARIAEIMASDPLGEFFSAVQSRAIANALKRDEEAAKGAASANRELERAMREAAAVMREVQTPAEAYAATMEKLNRLLAAGAISQEIYARAAAKAKEKLEELETVERRRALREEGGIFGGAAAFLDEYAEKAGNVASVVEESFKRGFSSIEDAIGQFVRTGKVEFSSLISSMLADLAKLAVRSAVLGPIANALSGALGGGGFGSIFASVLHGGGRPADGVPVLAPASLFASAPRFHSGRAPFLAPNEQAAIIRDDERVLNPRETRAYEADRRGNITVNIMARDAESFRRSRTQVASDLARAVAFGQRGL